MTGLLKIHWNLKNPIQLSTEFSDKENCLELNVNNVKSEEQTSFKATPLKTLNDKKGLLFSFDDSSIDSNRAINAKSNDCRSHTVKLKSKAPRQTVFNSEHDKNKVGFSLIKSN